MIVVKAQAEALLKLFRIARATELIESSGAPARFNSDFTAAELAALEDLEEETADGHGGEEEEG